MAKKGLLIVYTGNGKGKTTAALGLAYRMLGHKKRVSMIQFIKGSWKYGEMESVKRYADLLDFHVMGKGFIFKSEDQEADVKAAREAWELAEQTIAANRHQLVILDELTYLIKFKMVPEDRIIKALTEKPEMMHVVVTGRDASERLIELADLVTEMREIKHPFHSGIKAQKGIEF
ncbi:MAG: cob(I)yrinic acid a,c-diamide adenosyltransferase [Deltaproteobacteria bacterium]|nr:cob(I)yrinic acid a,c-diamide adenosyltransferase [Deltaproteobacteria bacterium]